MLIKLDKHSFNVYCIDTQDLSIELWNHYNGWKMLDRQIVSSDEMIETLYQAARYNRVVSEDQCNAMSKELEAAQ